MELALVELLAERRLRFAPVPADLQLADLVGEGLGRPGDVALDLGGDLVLRERRVVPEIGHRLLTRPAELVQSRVDDQPAGAPHLVRQAPEVLVRRLVDAHHRAEPLGVEAPAFAIARERRAAPEGRSLRPLERQGGLHGVARRALVQCQRRQRVERTGGQVVGVHLAGIEPAAATRVDRRQRFGHRADAVAAARQEADGLGELPVGLLGHIRRVRQQLARGLRVELRIGAQELEEGRHAAGEAGALPGALHLLPDTRHLAQADLVDLLRGQWQRGELLDHRRVVGVAIRQRARPNGRPRAGQVLVAHERQQTGVCGGDDLAQHRLRLGAQCRLLGRRHRRRHLGERRVQGVGRVALHVGLDRAIAPDHRDARHGEAPGQAGPHVDDVLVEVTRHIAQAAQIGAIRGGRAEPLTRREGRPEEGVAVERRLVGAEADVGSQRRDGRPEHLGVDLLLGRQLIDGNGVECRQCASPVGEPRLLRRRADAREPVARAAVAGRIAPAPQLLATPVPLLGVQRPQSLVGRRGRRRRLCGSHAGQAGESEAEGRQRAKAGAAGHVPATIAQVARRGDATSRALRPPPAGRPGARGCHRCSADRRAES